MTDSVLTEQVGNGDAKALQQPRFGAFARMPAAHELKLAAGQMQDFHRERLGINQPILFDAVLFVEVALVNPVAPAGVGRDDFCNQVGRTHEPRLDDVKTFSGNEHDVGLSGPRLGEHHVERGDSSLAETPLADVTLQVIVEGINDLLMKEGRRGRHDKFSIPKFRGYIAFRQFGDHLVKRPLTVRRLSCRRPGLCRNHGSNKLANEPTVKRLPAWMIHLNQSINRFVSPAYASIRRSRRNGQCVRVVSSCPRSTGTISVSSWSALAWARISPKVPATKLCPQNSRPAPPAGRSWPIRLGTATKQPLATAWLRWMSCQASCWVAPCGAFSPGCQPMAVG